MAGVATRLRTVMTSGHMNGQTGSRMDRWSPGFEPLWFSQLTLAGRPVRPATLL